MNISLSSAARHKESSKTDCFHCGENCNADVIIFQSNNFCCNGCKTVFSLLEENGLQNYYLLELQPGISIKNAVSSDKYKFLDNDDIADQLLDFQDETIRKISFLIPSIHCSSCIWLLENLSRLDPLILVSRVNFMKKEVYITFDHALDLRKVVELIASLGYEPTITLQGTEKDQTNPQTSLLYRIGVAGFFGGNIMMLSFAEYVGGSTFLLCDLFIL